jgi:hypothetical protein
MAETTPPTVRDAVLYAQAVHCEAAHGAQLGVQAGCPQCFALARAVQAAEAAQPSAVPNT